MARKPHGTIRPCAECEKPMRPKTWKAEDHPGTVVHATSGRCSKCNYAHVARLEKLGLKPTAPSRKPKTKDKTARPCAGDCGKMLRNKEWKTELFPNTIIHRGRGLCYTCYDAEYGRAERLIPVTTPRPSYEENLASLRAYFASRRPYREALGQTFFPDPLDATANRPENLVPIKHGTASGYDMESRRNVEHCEPCIMAKRKANRESHHRRKQAKATA